MPLRITKPAFNLRAKLNELDYPRVPLQKTHSGAILQVKYTMIHNGASSSYNSNNTSYNDTGHDVLITPQFASSKILVSLGVQIYATNSAYHSYVGIVRDDNTGSGNHDANNDVLFHASTLWESSGPVSYTHMTLPTSDLV